jgi:hypothetical protein
MPAVVAQLLQLLHKQCQPCPTMHVRWFNAIEKPDHRVEGLRDQRIISF